VCDKINNLEFILNGYILKNSSTRSVFLSDYKLLKNFSKFVEKHKHNDLLVYNQLIILTNLFTVDAVDQILLEILDDDLYKKIKNMIHV
jgi:hypothetical protein